MSEMRALVSGALALLLGFCCLAVCCSGDLMWKLRPSDNVFDDIIKCDIQAFAEEVGAKYVGEKLSLDNGLVLECVEGGFRTNYMLSRESDPEIYPCLLTFSKTTYVPVADGAVVAVDEVEKYSSKTKELRGREVRYRRSETTSSGEADSGGYLSMNTEEAERELEAAGFSGVGEDSSCDPAEHLVALFCSCMDSSFAQDDWGSFVDCR